MRNHTTSAKLSTSLLALCLLAACTTVPTGPSILVLPGTGKSFDQFRADDVECRQFASAQIGGTTPESVAADSGMRSAIVGTALGAAAGAAINGHQGAAAGAGVGLLTGGLAGTGAANASAYGTQRRYDFGYTQCMYSKGNRVPVSGHITSGSYQQGSYQQGSYQQGAYQQEYMAPPPPTVPPPPPSAWQH